MTMTNQHGQEVRGDLDEGSAIDEWESRPATVPDRYTISIRCLETDEKATEFGQLLGEFVRQLSRVIDLKGLDGITIATDYGQALAELDRGYATAYTLTATDKHGVGVAMTPHVLRDDLVKSHILFRSDLILPLADTESEDFDLALHLLAHECAHVEITNRYDRCFPRIILQKPIENRHQQLRWHAITSCWDEYAATWISATIGRDPTAGYEETFEKVLSVTRTTANDSIKAFQRHGDADQVFTEVYSAYATLMKFSSYLLGTMAGRGLVLKDLPRTHANLEGHWFCPFFQRLRGCLEAVGKDYGKWTTNNDFEAIGDLADELVAAGGLTIVGDQFHITKVPDAP